MSSLESSGDEAVGIAEELASAQRSISIAEFFEKNKHMLGFDSEARALVTAVKEGCDNAVDASEEAGILPDIYVKITENGDYYRIVIEDNGPGITREQIPKVFGKLLYGSRFHKREQSLTPDQQLLVRRDGEIEFVPIGVLCNAYLPTSEEGIAPISDDISVPSFDRETHEMSWQPVVHAIRHRTREETYEISTARGRSVEVTGNHSLFTLSQTGETREVEARELEPGDFVLAPRRLPELAGETRTVNLLTYIPVTELADRRLYVYGFSQEDLEELKDGEKIRKYANETSNRKRTFYRYDGVDVLKDSLESNYIPNGYLPAEIVRRLGWEEKARDCTLRTYQVGGKQTSIPVTVSLTEDFMRLLAYYVCEGHASPRQIGLTFGSDEEELIATAEAGLATIGGGSTTVEKDRNATRVKGFGSPIALFLKHACGDAAQTKRIPSFVFNAPVELQRVFMGAMYQGDGSNATPQNAIVFTTTSEELARQVSMWWNTQGVLASTSDQLRNDGYSRSPTITYHVKVYSEDVEELRIFQNLKPVGEQSYKRVPTRLLEPVQVSEPRRKTVPDTIPGLLVGAGITDSLDRAESYLPFIQQALTDGVLSDNTCERVLSEKGLLDMDGIPTPRLRELWETIENLHGITNKDVCLLEVMDICQTISPDYVYDISVPGATGGDENFAVINDGALTVKNSRGQQGIGISAAVLYAQLTSGKPAKITSRTQGSTEAEYFELIIDTDDNEPEIRKEGTTRWDRPHGTRIELEMEANMRARQQLHDYIKQTAVVNPHARIELHEPDETLKYERVTDELPPETEEIRPHPHGVELGTVIKMLAATDSHSLSGFLQSEFTRVGRKTADEIIDGFRDRHFGREMTWEPPAAHADPSIESAVTEATVNKGKDPTAQFAGDVGAAVRDLDRVGYSDIEAIVARVADEVEAAFDRTFGRTVQENAVDAAWDVVTAEMRSDLYRVVDDATSDRKDDRVIEGLATRLAEKFVDEDNPKQRLTRAEIVDFVDRTSDMTADVEDVSIGETARENIVEAIWTGMHTVPDDVPKVRSLANDRDAASALVSAMRAANIMAPPTDCLAPIKPDLIEAGLRKEYDAEFFSSTTRDGQVHAGDPFIVEAGIAFGGELEEEGQVDVLRFANRVPLVYQRGACATTDVLRGIGWRNYGLEQPGGTGLPHGPGVIMVHVASTNVPFTSESKDAIANIPEIEDEIELAVRECARELKSYLNRRRSLAQRREKQDVLARILPRMATKVATVTGRDSPDIDDALARIMNNVIVDRSVENGTVQVTIQNHSDRKETLEITEILEAEPNGLSDGLEVMEMDGEWFLSRTVTVEPGDSIEQTYAYPTDAAGDLVVEGIDDELVTVTQ